MGESLCLDCVEMAVTVRVNAVRASRDALWHDRRGRCMVWGMRIVVSHVHPAGKVDPFGRLPCRHGSVTVHITDTASMGSDLVECRRCGYAMRLADLYQGLFPAGMAAEAAP